MWPRTGFKARLYFVDKTISKNFFLISFLPALAYWYLEENYPVSIAITGGLILSILEISLEYYFTKHVHTMSKFNFFLILFLGALSILGDDGIWFKLQPAFTGVGIASFLIYRLSLGKGMLIEMMDSMPNKAPIPEFIINSMEKHVAALFMLYGLFMVTVALWMSTDRWLFFKTIGFYIIFGIFMVFEMILIRLKMKKYFENIKKAEFLSNLRP